MCRYIFRPLTNSQSYNMFQDTRNKNKHWCAVQLRDGCMRGDRQGCQQLLQEVKRNFNTLKGRLEIFMQLETQRKLLLSGGM